MTTAPTPMALQPLSISELLDAAIRLCRHHFSAFAGIVAVFEIPRVLLGVLLTLTIGSANEPDARVVYLVARILGLIGFFARGVGNPLP